MPDDGACRVGVADGGCGCVWVWLCMGVVVYGCGYVWVWLCMLVSCVWVWLCMVVVVCSLCIEGGCVACSHASQRRTCEFECTCLCLLACVSMYTRVSIHISIYI